MSQIRITLLVHGTLLPESVIPEISKGRNKIYSHDDGSLFTWLKEYPQSSHIYPCHITPCMDHRNDEEPHCGLFTSWRSMSCPCHSNYTHTTAGNTPLVMKRKRKILIYSPFVIFSNCGDIIAAI